MGFLLGFMTGMLGAFALFGFLAWWLCSRSNNIALAKFINGIAQALAHKRKPLEPVTAGEGAKVGEGAKDKWAMEDKGGPA